MGNKKILLIGGGTGGHILPLKNLADEFLAKNWQIKLIVSNSELDKKIIKQDFPNIPTIFFKTDKIRRYFDWKNFLAPFKILKSITNAQKILKNEKPVAVFFKGGFVGFPFLMAVKLHNFFAKKRLKIFGHESDISFGFLSKLVKKSADKFFHSFAKTPFPLFFEIKKNSVSSSNKTNILIFGGSQGSLFINNLFVKNAKNICDKYQVFLVSGLEKKINFSHKNFQQIEILEAQKLGEKIKNADLIISRAGSNSLFEIICAKIPSIIIPLPSSARNHQEKNAQYFSRKNLCILEKESPKIDLENLIKTALNDKNLQENLNQAKFKNSAAKICENICDFF